MMRVAAVVSLVAVAVAMTMVGEVALVEAASMVAAVAVVVEEVSSVRTHLSSSRPRCRPGIAPPVGSSLRSSPQKFEIS